MTGLVRGARRLQRLTEEEIRDAAEYSWASNALSGAVIKRIAEKTTAWENSGDAPVPRRMAIRSELDALFQSSEIFGKTFPKPDDPEYWADVVDRLTGKLDAAKVKKQQQPLLERGRTVVPLGERWTIHCTMGQAVIASLARYTLFSDQFSSCSPVVLFNRDTYAGGLMHYGAGSPIQKAELRSMYEKIEPTDIGLNWRISSATGEKVADRRDFDELRSFFKDELQAKAEIHEIGLQSNQYAVFLDDKGRLNIESERPASQGTFDATNMTTGAALNKQVDLLVNEKVYTSLFATGVY